MIKISVGIAYEQNRPTGVASAPIAQLVFFAEKCLRNALYKNFFRQKLLQITIRNFQCKNIFDRSTGVASALTAQFSFLAKSALKMRCTKCFARQKLLQIKIHNYNHTFPEYLISTIPHPRRINRHTHRPRKRKNCPNNPSNYHRVVRLITPPCYPLRIHRSTPTNPLNSNFGELDGGRLARLFCFILNFEFIFLLNFRLVIFLNIFVFIIY